MDTRKKKNRGPRQFYLREWREAKNARAVELADAAGVERESYYRLEREPWRISLEQLQAIADKLDLVPSQFWFPPDGAPDLNSLVAGATPEVQGMIYKAVKGMVEK